MVHSSTLGLKKIRKRKSAKIKEKKLAKRVELWSVSVLRSSIGDLNVP